MTGATRMNAGDKRARLAALLAGDRCVVAGSVFDPLSARIAEDIGFDVGVLGGSGASLAVLGAPDIMLLTLSELAEQTRRICRASDLPVLVDADHGYGNALNVMRTVEELAHAGACGISIEDTLLPRAFGSPGKSELTSVEEGAGKMRAAVAAAKGSGMAIFGRTSALSVSSLDDTVLRLRAYERVGVHAVFVPYLKSRVQLDRIASEIALPIILGSPASDLVDLPYLASRRVRICLRGHQSVAASVQALFGVAKAMHAGVSPETLTCLAPDALMARLTRVDDYEQRISQFLNPETNPKEI